MIDSPDHAATNVLVVGYPKSGNTWVTRLVGDLLDAPVRGFWGEPDNDEIAIEGLERQSQFSVYKGHQPSWQVPEGSAAPAIVYVARDVRDVVVSAAHFFNPPLRSAPGRWLERTPSTARWVGSVTRRAPQRRVREMIRVLSEGDARVNRWLATPWDEHVRGYMHRGVCIVRYEDLLIRPEIEVRRILAALAIDAPQEHIRSAIERQSFGSLRRRLEREGRGREHHLRVGKARQWERELSSVQIDFLQRRFGSTLRALGYF